MNHKILAPSHLAKEHNRDGGAGLDPPVDAGASILAAIGQFHLVREPLVAVVDEHVVARRERGAQGDAGWHHTHGRCTRLLHCDDQRFCAAKNMDGEKKMAEKKG